MKIGDTEKIVITGASSGIGRELACQLAGEGKEMWLIGRDDERLAQVAAFAREKGAVAHAVLLDLMDFDQANRFLNETFPPEVRVEAVYLDAAISIFGEMKDILIADWQKVYDSNLASPVQWALHFYQNMILHKAGKIIFISSLSACTGYPTAIPYATTKAGLLGFYKSLKYEAKSHGISVHLGVPGFVDTGIYQAAIYRETTYQKTMAEIRSLGYPLLTAKDAASRILKGIRRGKSEFAFPFYTAGLKWLSPRFPWMIDRIHNKILREFRKTP